VAEFEAALARKTKDTKEANAKVLAAEAASNEVLRTLREEHGEAFEKLRASHTEELRESRQRERVSRCELEVARKELDRIRGTNPGDSGDAPRKQEDGEEEEGGAQASVKVEEGTLHKAEGGDDVRALRDHIAYLENRCSKLQRQLNSRPIVSQYKPLEGASGGATQASALPWEPELRARLGPRASAIVVQAYGVPNRAMRRFTELLLRKDARLWLFYFHVIVLYMIVSSCASSSSSGPGQKVVGKTIEQQARAPR